MRRLNKKQRRYANSKMPSTALAFGCLPAERSGGMPEINARASRHEHRMAGFVPARFPVSRPASRAPVSPPATLRPFRSSSARSPATRCTRPFCSDSWRPWIARSCVSGISARENRFLPAFSDQDGVRPRARRPVRWALPQMRLPPGGSQKNTSALQVHHAQAGSP